MSKFPTSPLAASAAQGLAVAPIALSPAPAPFARPTLSITLGLGGELALLGANGALTPIREGFAEDILRRLLKDQAALSAAGGTTPLKVPACIPSYEYEALQRERKAQAVAVAKPRIFTARGREVVPDVSLEDLGL